ncbi:MAG: transcriptional repressor NrdR [Chloroflexi bacterium]|nr:transcriptional repressor NrdR [Chloroflexota bacterium]
MHCPHCGLPDSRVLDTRDVEGGIRRRRQCLRCQARYTTYERVQTSALMVVKRDGRREEFDREKLLGGVRKACAKRPLPAGAVEKVVGEIEEELEKMGRSEVASPMLGEMVMERLRRLDRVAYIRFASVYRDFADEQDFRRAVDALQREPAPAPTAQLPLLPLEPPRDGGRTRRGRVGKR